MIFYLTGTGNSRWAARLLADHLQDTAEDAAPYLKSGLTPSLHSEKPWIFVCPTYGWQIPHIFADLLRRTGFDGSKKAYFILTCGGDIGAAGPRLQKLCGEIGLEYCGVLPLIMPENYVAMFPVPGEEEAQKIGAVDFLVQGTASGSHSTHCRGKTVPGAPPFPVRSAEKRPGKLVFLPFLHQKQPFLHHCGLQWLRPLCQNVLHQLYCGAGGQTPLGKELHPLYGLHLRLSAARH